MKLMNIGAIASRELSHFDPLRLRNTFDAPSTLRVNSDERAVLVAEQAVRLGARLIVTTNDTGAVSGLVAPDWILRQVVRVKGKQYHRSWRSSSTWKQTLLSAREVFTTSG